MDTAWKCAPRKKLVFFPVKCAIEAGILQACWAAIEQLFIFQGPRQNTSLPQHKGQWLLGRRCGEECIGLS